MKNIITLHITESVFVLILQFIFLLNKDLCSNNVFKLPHLFQRQVNKASVFFVCYRLLKKRNLTAVKAVRVVNLKVTVKTCAGQFVSAGGAKEQRLTSSDPLTSISLPPTISPLILFFSCSNFPETPLVSQPPPQAFAPLSPLASTLFCPFVSLPKC